MKKLAILLLVMCATASCQSPTGSQSASVETKPGGPFAALGGTSRSATRNGQTVMTETKLIADQGRFKGQTYTNYLVDLELRIFCKSNLVYVLSANHHSVSRQYPCNAIGAAVSETDEDGDGLPDYVIVSTPDKPREEIIVRGVDGQYSPVSQKKLDRLQEEDIPGKHDFHIMLNHSFLLD